MGRELMVGKPPERIVSLVPSETETLFALGLGDRIVGRTTYCEEPADQVGKIPTVGGTKDVDVEAVCDLSPDIVFANQEENARAPLEALADKRVPLFVSFPRRVADGIALVARMARICGVDRDPGVSSLVARSYRAVAAAEAKTKVKAGVEASTERPTPTVFVPIWLEPLMTISQQTFGSDMLRLAGAENVFADRTRRYPLKADLGLASPLAADRAAHRDVRYPRITEAELLERAPSALLLPDEPYAFTAAEGQALAALGFESTPTVSMVSGKDLFWYGSRIADALERLTAVIEAL